VAWKHSADLLGAGQRLVQFHAGSTWIGEDRINSFAFERFHKNFASQHGTTHGNTLGRAGYGLGRFGGFSHTLSLLFHGGAAGKGKTHDRFQPWVLVEICSLKRDKFPRRRLRRQPLAELVQRLNSQDGS
jgi:hypothetical protein